MRFHTIFLSVSGLSFRLRDGSVAFGSLDAGCLYFVNHDRSSFVTKATADVLDDAAASGVGTEQFLGVFTSADKRGAVSWAMRHRLEQPRFGEATPGSTVGAGAVLTASSSATASTPWRRTTAIRPARLQSASRPPTPASVSTPD
jgi:hypothetical protein